MKLIVVSNEMKQQNCQYNNLMESRNRQQNKQSLSKPTRFYLGSHERYIVFNSHFDSGNIRVLKQISDFQYRLECVDDTDLSGKKYNSKSWFYFEVKGFPKQTKGKFYINKVQALTSIYYSKYSKYYRPVYRVVGEIWKRFQSDVEINMNQNGDIECVFEYLFQNQDQNVQFAFCYPYQFSKNIEYLQSLKLYEKDSQIYYNQQILIQSPQKRPIHLLTITSKNNKQEQLQQLFNPLLFPEKKRAIKFKKHVVLLTARVHPGETPASYAMQGVINFLLDKQDLRAFMLRKMFVFMIVPMINVDGVFHGHFRMDIHGKNLNRFYINPNPETQPAIYAIKQLAKHLINQNRLSFYFDLHGHNAKKGCFIYGNAFNDFVEQVQSQVFCKLFSMNHSGFQYQYCNFSQKHMNAKDRFQDLTKQGCGRVVMHKAANIIHSYSLQCGILSANNRDTIPSAFNIDFKAYDKGFIKQEMEQQGNQGIKMPDETVLFNQNSYRNLGKNLLVSILDVFDKNPYNRVYNSRYKTMDMLRRLTAFEIFHSAQRFRMFERSVFGKVKNINFLVQQILSTKEQYKQLYNFAFSQDDDIQRIDWPRNVLGLAKSIINKPRKIRSFNEAKVLLLEEENKQGKTQSLKSTQVETQRNQKLGGRGVDDQQINMDRTETIQLQACEVIEDTKWRSQSEQNKNKKIKDEIAQTQEAQYDSGESDAGETQINQQIILMCENQKEEKELIDKIMHNDFNQKDYEFIQQKYKHKNDIEGITDRKVQISSSNTEHNNKVFNREFSSYKDNKYKNSIDRKSNINTCEISKKYKKKIMVIKGDETIDNNINSGQYTKKKLSAAQQFRKNIYDAIKQEIKEGLRKQYERKKISERIDNKLIDSFRSKNNHRVRAHNYLDSKRLRSKVKLPSLGANMYIITTSTRLLQKM